MKRVIRRTVLSAAALSPGVAAVFVHEMALILLGVTGFFSAVAVTIAVSPKIGETLASYDAPRTEYPSLLLAAASDFLATHCPDPLSIRARLHGLIAPGATVAGSPARDDRIAMALSSVMTRWGETDIHRLSDDQVRELWLIERILCASPAEAGALAQYFAAPNAILAMRDQIANTVPA